MVNVNPKIEKIFAVLNKKTDARIGFADIDLWADTGIYALNRKLSNTYDKGLLYGRTVGIYGESGSGKSLFLAQTAGNEQRNKGAYVVWIDVEGAVSDLKTGEQWFKDAGVSIDPASFRRIHINTFRDSLVTMAEFVNNWRADEYIKELPPLFIVFDSYSNLQTDSMIEQNKGKKDLTADMGQKAKQLGDFLIRTTGMIEGLRILVTGVMHVYMSQELYGPKHKLGGGMKGVFTASQSILFTKSDLTNKKAAENCPHLMQGSDADDRKNIGIRSTAQLIKCRYAKPYETVHLDALYGYGIDKYSGLFDLMLEDNVVSSPSKGWYEYRRPDGTAQKFQRKSFLKYVDELLTLPVPPRVMNREEDFAGEVFDG